MAPGRSSSARLLLASALAFVLPGCGSTPDAPPAADGTPASGPSAPSPFALLPGHEALFTPGEHLVYSVVHKIFPAGTIFFDTRMRRDDAGPVLVFEAYTRPTPLADLLADVGGVARSCVDPATLLSSTYFFRNLREKDSKKRVTEFFSAEGLVRTVEIRDDNWRSEIFRTTGASDPLASLFLVRALDFDRVDPAVFHVVEGVGFHLMTVRRVGREPLRVKGGEDVPAIRLHVRTDRLENDGGLTPGQPPHNDLQVWLSDDAARVILRCEGLTRSGEVKITLESREIPADAAEAR